MNRKASPQIWLAISSGAAILVAVIFAPYTDKSSKPPEVTREGPLLIKSARLVQSGPDLVLKIKTSGQWQPSQISKSSKRYLCARFLHERKQKKLLQICVEDRRRSDKASLILTGIEKNGDVVSKKHVKASIERPSASSISASFRPAQADISPGTFRWWIVSRWSGKKCEDAPSFIKVCGDRFPQSGTARLKVRKAQIVGCKWSGELLYLNGPRNRREVALTFDDGPSAYTQKILRLLGKYKAKATFFVWGVRTNGRESVLRQLIDSGHEIGNHSWNHHQLPTYKELSATSKNYRRMSGFKPCLFRPPYRVYDRKLLVAAKRAGMQTILWDVDSRDWRRPGANAIANTILNNTQTGSIILMHDGGGPREQTVTALKRVLKKLRARGYRFVTVSELLGNSVVWSPRKKPGI